MKTHYLVPIIALFLVGCDPFQNPFQERQQATQQFITQAKAMAEKLNKKYKPEIREIKPYQVYSYQVDLEDPFRARQFIIQEQKVVEKKLTVVEQKQAEKCLPPKCVPPTPHEKSLLEQYSLSALGFVGTVADDNGIGLIETPDFGILPVRVGEYMGRNNGKVILIKETAIVLQEKIRRGGLWKDKKTVLVIKR